MPSEQVKKENLAAAMNDLKFSVKDYEWRNEDIDQHSTFKKLIWKLFTQEHDKNDFNDVSKIDLNDHLTLHHTFNTPYLCGSKPDFSVQSKNDSFSSIYHILCSFFC